MTNDNGINDLESAGWCRLGLVMFCPQCKAEYRPGFTRCADCDVDLVYALPAVAELGGSSEEASTVTDEDPFCSFWKGDDPRIHSELCAVLDDAGIPHKTVRRHDHLFNLSNYPAFQIGVPFSLYENAEMAVKDAFDLDSSDPNALQTLSVSRLLPVIPESSRATEKLPPISTPPEDENIPGPAADGSDSDWPSEEATAEVWAGDDSWLSDMIVASLRENQIPVRRDNAAGKQILSVLPEDEDRARDIVREIVEGAPPA